MQDKELTVPHYVPHVLHQQLEGEGSTIFTKTTKKEGSEIDEEFGSKNNS